MLVLAGATGSWSGGKVKKIYVGNLSFNSTEDDVKQLFSQHGTVHSVALINDRQTGRPRGFGFVEMDDSAATAAISALDGHEMDGRNLRVNEAQDRPRGFSAHFFVLRHGGPSLALGAGRHAIGGIKRSGHRH